MAERWLFSITSDEFEGRRAGTIGCKKASEYIEDQVFSMGYTTEVIRFHYSDATLRNIVVPVGDVKDTVIVVGAHYDGQFESTPLKKYPAADDNASGVVTALLLLQKIKEVKDSLRYPVLICFWDGEEHCYGDIFKGSRHFVNTNNNTVLYYINVDAIGHDHDQSNTMSFLYRGDVVSDKVKEILNSNLFQFRYFKAPKGSGSSDHVPFDDKDIPYISFYDSPASKHKECGHNLHTVNDVPEAVSIERMVNLSELVFQLLNK